MFFKLQGIFVKASWSDNFGLSVIKSNEAQTILIDLIPMNPYYLYLCTF